MSAQLALRAGIWVLSSRSTAGTFDIPELLPEALVPAWVPTPTGWVAGWPGCWCWSGRPRDLAGGIGAGEKLAGIMVDGAHLPGDSTRWFEPANDHFTGISIGLINYSRDLHGVQFGWLNYTANNPRWARLLLFINVPI
jgi:hypothetical protein